MTQESKAGERLGRAAGRVTDLVWKRVRSSGLTQLALEKRIEEALRELTAARRQYEGR